MSEFIKISDRQTVSARELYKALGLDLTHWNRWAKQNIEENKFAIKGQDFEELAIVASGEVARVQGNFAQDYQLSIDFAKRLCMLARTGKGELIRNYFIEVEKQFYQIAKPESIEDLIIMQAQSVKELKTKVESQSIQIETIKDTIITNPDQWRNWVNEKINLIACERGNLYFETKSESYKLLEDRGHCNLDERLKNRKNNLRDVGANKTKIDLVNKLDVIEDDPKLKEIYATIIKEMLIKYVA